MSRITNKLAAVGDQVKEAYDNGATLGDLAQLYEVSTGTIRNKLHELGTDMRPRGRRRLKRAPSKILPVEELPKPNEPQFRV